jgi:hypothetical protein
MDNRAISKRFVYCASPEWTVQKNHHRNNNNIIVAGLWAAGPFRVIPIRKILFFFSAEAYCQFRLLSSPAASLAQLCCVWFNWKLFGFFLSFFFYLFSPDRRRKRERVCALSDEFPTFTESDAIVCVIFFSLFFLGGSNCQNALWQEQGNTQTHARFCIIMDVRSPEIPPSYPAGLYRVERDILCSI